MLWLYDSQPNTSNNSMKLTNYSIDMIGEEKKDMW